MKNRAFLAAICLMILFSACSKTPKLKVEGNISNAKDTTLYFEIFGMNKIEIIDSVKLNNKGTFHFKTKLPDAPEFYRLRIGDRYIQLGADSSATVVINADGKNFGSNYTVEGSRCCELIRELSVSQSGILVSVDSLNNLYKSKQLADSIFQRKVQKVLNGHREKAIKIILENPKSPAAYFALFQRLYDNIIFDPFNKEDSRYFSAVATSWDAFYPKADRSKNLVNLTLQGIKELRKNNNKKEFVINEQYNTGYFEINLPDVYGKEVALSSLKGKVVLLDFTAYQSESSSSRNLRFRELHNKFNRQGFEIYQVSFDADDNLWKTGASNLPWICVHDRSGIQSKYLTTYNVREIPTFFLMDKGGNIVARDAMISDLNKEIMKLL